MTAATLIYNGDVGETADIITAIGGSAATALVIIPGANSQQVSIYLIS